ncbi:1,4-alpha-glucan branching protein [Streptomyces sp. NPDC097619]|uniref:maltokinase N-terminal cap-like domain-containing protein n=1 Tax=Streptomyces sp. NPDC097619 TaxID=3157228 RepID=UPI003328044D
MAIIHRTTVTPGKLELLAGWLPAQPWYAGGARPDPAKAGGFRLDDPAGEVGIEFMLVTEGEGAAARAYQVPLTYRGAPLEGAEAGLVGTTEHGVLGRRWVYDGTHDPVCAAQLLALFRGEVAAQAQNESDVPDPTVVVLPGPVPGTVEGATRPVHGEDATVLAVDTAAGPVPLTVVRVLRPAAGADLPAGAAARIEAGWRLPDGAEVRGTLAVLGGDAAG